MKDSVPPSSGNPLGRGEQAAIFLLAAALHALVIYRFALFPAPAPVQPAAVPAAVELTLSAPPLPAAAPPEAEAAPPKPETPPPVVNEELAPAPTKTPETPPPPKPVEKRVAKKADRPTKPTPSRQQSAKSAPGRQTNAAPVDTPAPARLAAEDAITPASASASHLNNSAPRYPALALKRKWEGTVQLQVRVLANGQPGEIRILRSSGRDILDQAAVAAVRKWSFVPAQRGAVPLDSWATFPLSFKLQ
ncbi:energy transducer TonB [Brenneria populi subsp. brevivirga]|uniref:energy transducer TonB n=1 Tax=Brenneria populi TaxID=1505588 RepID=UPI002E175A70|nr:energy transducer TonB [Brenneria populi subsp. brevivirga]